MPGFWTRSMRRTFGRFVRDTDGGNPALVMNALNHAGPRHTLRIKGGTSLSVRDMTMKLNIRAGSRSHDTGAPETARRPVNLRPSSHANGQLFAARGT